MESQREALIRLLICVEARVDRLINDINTNEIDNLSTKRWLLEWKILNTYVATLGDKIKSL